MSANPFPSGTISFNDLRTGFGVSGQLAMSDLNNKAIYDSSTASTIVKASSGNSFSMDQFQNKYVTCFGNRVNDLQVSGQGYIIDNSSISQINYTLICPDGNNNLNNYMYFTAAMPSILKNSQLILDINTNLYGIYVSYLLYENDVLIDSQQITSSTYQPSYYLYAGKRYMIRTVLVKGQEVTTTLSYL